MNTNRIINKIKDYFFFMELTDNEILDVLNRYYKDKKISEEKLMNSILKYYYTLIKKQILNGNFTSINNYISKKLSYNIKCINNLSNLFQKLELDINFELYEKMINQSSLLQEILGKTLKKLNYNQNDIEKFSNGLYTDNLIQTYVILNNIELTTNQEEDISDINHQFLNGVYKIPLLSIEEEKRLTMEYYKTKDPYIRDRIFEANLRLVIDIVKKINLDRLSFYDLFQDGSIGLLKAIDGFDPTKGYRLSTYAVWAIKREIDASIGNTSRIIRIPLHKIDEINKYKKLKEELEKRRGKELKIEEISQELDIPLKDVIDNELLIDKIMLIDSVNININDEETEIIDVVPDQNTKVEDEAIKNVELDILRKALLKLSEKERQIIQLRFGLNGDNPMSFESIASVIGNTGEGIRKSVKRSLLKLKKEIMNQNINQIGINVKSLKM